MTRVVIAAPSIGQEPELVRSAPAAGVTVVRRCVEAADLLAAAVAAPDAVVVVCAGLPRLSPEIVDTLGDRVVGLAVGPDSATALTDAGVESLVAVGDTPAATWKAVLGAARSDPVGGSTRAPAGVWSAGAWMGDPAEPGARHAVAEASPPRRRDGSVVAVWGPAGAPGRTTVALSLADAWAVGGRSVCVVDADTYAPSVALWLGLDDAASDLVVAARCAQNRSVAGAALAAAARPVRGSLVAIGGLAATSRWPELPPAALDRLWSAAREAFDVTVVDVGFCLEREPGDGLMTLPRNAAATTAIDACDVVVCVADACDLGAARLAAAWPELVALAPGRPRVVVRNRARTGSRAWRQAMTACGVDAPVVELPADPGALAACWGRAQTLGEGARRSRLRRAVESLASTCLPAAG